MPASVGEFAKAAEDSGILTARLLAEYMQGIAPDSDARALANRLVKDGRLTTFQAKYIYVGKASSLVLGPYIVLDLLGKGGMGFVYKAEHRKMRRVVALKVIAKAALKSPAAVQRFEREVQAAARLEHPNIVTAHDAGEAAGTHYLVMQFVDGRNLSDVVKELGPQRDDRAIDWILQAARGLAYAHGKGVVHRDIKPANLLIDQEGTVRILDMGLALLETLDTDQDQLTGTGQIMGTVDYMAPEQAMDTRQADARSDIYSLGVTLWFLLTGRPLFSGDTAMNKMMAHMQTPAPALASVRGDVRPEVEPVFQRMVAKKPADRFQSMQEVIAALQSLPQSEAAAGPPSIDFGAGPTSLGAPGTPANTAVQRPKAVAVDENTARLSAVDLDTAIGLKKVTPKTQRSKASLTPRHLVIGGGAVGALLLAGLMVFAFGGRRDVKTVGGGWESGGGLTSESTPSRDSVASVVVAKPTAPAPPSAAAAPRYALDCSEGTDIRIPSLLLVANEPLTVEMTVTASQGPTQEHVQRFLFETPYLHLKQYSYSTKSKSSNQWKWIAATPGAPSANVFYTTLSSADIVTGKPHQLAGVSTGNELRLFVDGRLVASGTVKGRLPPTTSPVTLAGKVASNPFFGGLLTEVRISKVARYEKDYTPQARLEADGNTLGLYHFDEGTGDVLKDSSGNGHHGTITGAKWVRADGSPIASVPAAGPTPPPAVAPFDAKTARAHQDAWAKHLGIPVESRNSVGQTMILIPPGEFLMGSTDEQVAAALTVADDIEAKEGTTDSIRNESPQETVRIPAPFLIGATEVTIGQFKQFVTATGYKTRAEKEDLSKRQLTYLDPGVPVTPDCPAAWINWNDARAYCEWLSKAEHVEYRLPTEAEWEYACRAGTVTQYYFGDDLELLDKHCWSGRNYDGVLHPVGTKLPNPFGLYDTYGNVSEWCAESGRPGSIGSPATAVGDVREWRRVTRGGGIRFYVLYCRSAARYPLSLFHAGDHFGFRIVRELPAASTAASVTP